MFSFPLLFQENQQAETKKQITSGVKISKDFIFHFLLGAITHFLPLKTSMTRSRAALMWHRINAGTHFGDALRVSDPSAEPLKSPTLHALPQSGLMLRTVG